MIRTLSHALFNPALLTLKLYMLMLWHAILRKTPVHCFLLRCLEHGQHYLCYGIACLTTEQSPEYTNKIRSLLRENKSICKPLDSLPPLRPCLDHNVLLAPDSTVPPAKSAVYHPLN
jgi:hypothetical protein